MATHAELDHLPHTPAEGRPFDPAPELSSAQEQGARCRVRLGDGSEAWLILAPDLARKLLTDPRLSSDVNQPGFPVHGHVGGAFDGFAMSMIRRDEPDHMRLRRLVAAEFRPGRVQELDELIQSIVDNSLERLKQAGTPADLVANFALAIPTELICALMGVPDREHAVVHAKTRVLTTFEASNKEIEAALADLGGCLRTVIEAKVREPGDDLLSRLVPALESEDLSIDELVSMAVLLVLAGHETTANTLALSVAQLLADPALKKRLQENPDLVPLAVEEFLRYNSVVRGGPRRVTTEAVDVDGVRFAPGEGVIFALHTINRDGELFERPDELEPERAGVRQHLAFGFGMHQCLGQALARRELATAISTLLAELPTIHLTEPQSGFAIMPEQSVYGLSELSVSW